MDGKSEATPKYDRGMLRVPRLTFASYRFRVAFTDCLPREQNGIYSSLWNTAQVEISQTTSRSAVALKVLNTPQLQELLYSTTLIQGRAALTRQLSAAFCAS